MQETDAKASPAPGVRYISDTLAPTRLATIVVDPAPKPDKR